MDTFWPIATELVQLASTMAVRPMATEPSDSSPTDTLWLPMAQEFCPRAEAPKVPMAKWQTFK